MSKRLNRHGTLYCSFCGYSQHEREQLIAGPGVHICEVCVQQAQEIITERRIERGVKAATLVKTAPVDCK